MKKSELKTLIKTIVVEAISVKEELRRKSADESLNKTPSKMNVKEEILKMIREEIHEMSRTAGSIGNKFKVQDPNSPTGWVASGHPKTPDGTPVPPPGKAAGISGSKPTGTPDSEEDEGDDEDSGPAAPVQANSKVSIVVDGDELPAKLDMNKVKGPIMGYLKSVLSGSNILMYKAHPSVQEKLDQLSDLYADDKLPLDAKLQLSIQKDGTISAI
jgi:hypothetical protein